MMRLPEDLVGLGFCFCFCFGFGFGVSVGLDFVTMPVSMFVPGPMSVFDALSNSY